VESLLQVGGTPVDLAMKPDGGEIFVSNYEAQTISAVGPYAGEVSESFLAGDHPVRGLVSSDNGTLYVSNFNSNNIAVFDASTRKLVTTVTVGTQPDALALSPSETMLLVANSGSGDVSVLRLDKRRDKKVLAPLPRLFMMIPTGERPSQIAVKTASKAG